VTVTGKVPARLRKTDDFKRVLSEGRRIRSRHLALTFLANGIGVVRLGISVPERTAKLAVRRNRLKRIVREGFRENFDRVPPGNDYVVAVLADPGHREGKVIRGEINELIGKCHQ
jgi:ribonuclease P protein component